MSPRGRIGRFGRVGRRPDHWSTPHERARARAAERLEAPLARREAAWLEAHLAECVACHAIAEMYAADRAALRQFRDDVPVPPRDLWARTAARIEQEAARRAPARRMRSRRPSVPVLGTLSGLALVSVVVIATAISGGFLGGIAQDGATESPSIALASQVAPSTEIEVGAGKVHWLGGGDDGVFAYNVADIDFVCRHDRQPDCAPFEDGHAKRVTLAATPRFVFQSPIDAQAVVVGTDANGADAVIVVPLPTPDATPEPSAVESPTASEGSTDASPGTPSEPTSPEPSASTDVVSFPATELPIDSAATGLPTASESAGAEPSAAAAVAIITNVAVVGRTASYSPDGTWFAFSARPADGSAGPDIYVWHVGDLLARALTTDHNSVFASWIGGSLLGSRVVAVALELDPGSPTERPDGVDPSASPSAPAVLDAAPSIAPGPATLRQAVVSSEPPIDASVAIAEPLERTPQAFLLDPSTGVEVPLLDAEWQPAVDPSGLAVVAWQGTVGIAADGLTAAPATGNLVIHPFHGPLESDVPFESSTPASASPSPTPAPTQSHEPVASASSPDLSSPLPSASASPEILRDFAPQVVAAGPIADFDARWDETGSWLAIWIADPVDPGLGRLSLLRFNPFTGLLDRPVGAPQDITALPGFSIGFGRLAWVSPPGQGGEGSRIQIAAWAADEVGAIESIPVNHAIVVQ